MLFRPAAPEDLAQCVSLLPPGFRISDEIRRHLPSIWLDLLRTGVMPMAVIEDPANSESATLEGFGASVFVDDQFADDLMREPRAFCAAHVYSEILAGRSPVLSWHDTAARNASGGLDVLVLHVGSRYLAIDDINAQRVARTANAALLATHVGYRINRLIIEVYGAAQARDIQSVGARLVSRFDADQSLVGVTEENRPHLFVLEERDVSSGAANPMSRLFSPPEPLLGFSAAAQQILVRAVYGQRDAQIAAALGITLDAVKKSWTRIYERVSRVAPRIIPEDDQLSGPGRGLEKRRQLLDYLRSHPEELRPRFTPKTPPRARP